MSNVLSITRNEHFHKILDIVEVRVYEQETGTKKPCGVKFK